MSTTIAKPLPGEAWLDNPRRAPMPATLAPDRTALAFHRSLPGYLPSPLVAAPVAAAALGAAAVWVKDESSRFGFSLHRVTSSSDSASLLRRRMHRRRLDSLTLLWVLPGPQS